MDQFGLSISSGSGLGACVGLRSRVGLALIRLALGLRVWVGYILGLDSHHVATLTLPLILASAPTLSINIALSLTLTP